MNPLVSLLRWSIKGMRKEGTRVPLVGLASQIFSYSFLSTLRTGKKSCAKGPRVVCEGYITARGIYIPSAQIHACVIRMRKCAIARCSTIKLCLHVGLNPLKSAPYYGKQGELSA